jgi:hypothetical protein
MTASTPSSSTGQLVQSLTEDAAALVRQELHRAQQELADKARQAGKGGALLGGAAVLGTMAVGTSTALVLRVLERRLSPTTAALLGTALFAGGAGALAAAALRELRAAGPLVPTETVASLREDVRAATAATSPTTSTPPATGTPPTA